MRALSWLGDRAKGALKNTASFGKNIISGKTFKDISNAAVKLDTKIEVAKLKVAMWTAEKVILPSAKFVKYAVVDPVSNFAERATEGDSLSFNNLKNATAGLGADILVRKIQASAWTNEKIVNPVIGFGNYLVVEPATNFHKNIKKHGFQYATMELGLDVAERKALIAQGVVRGVASTGALVLATGKVIVNNNPIRWAAQGAAHGFAAYTDMEWRPGDWDVIKIDFRKTFMGDANTKGWVDYTGLEDFVVWNNVRKGEAAELNGYQKTLMYSTQGVTEIGAFVVAGGGVGFLAKGTITAVQQGKYALQTGQRLRKIGQMKTQLEHTLEHVDDAVKAGQIAARISELRGVQLGATMNMELSAAGSTTILQSSMQGYEVGAKIMSPFYWKGVLNKLGAGADISNPLLVSWMEFKAYAQRATMHLADAETKAGKNRAATTLPVGDNSDEEIPMLSAPEIKKRFSSAADPIIIPASASPLSAYDKGQNKDGFNAKANPQIKVRIIDMPQAASLTPLSKPTDGSEFEDAKI